MILEIPTNFTQNKHCYSVSWSFISYICLNTSLPCQSNNLSSTGAIVVNKKYSTAASTFYKRSQLDSFELHVLHYQQIVKTEGGFGRFIE